MGTASSECQEKLRRVVKDLEGVEQIQDDVVVHRKGEAHDRNLEICLQRLHSFFYIRNLFIRKSVSETSKNKKKNKKVVRLKS